MKMYKRAEIVSWLEEYAQDPSNHFNCTIERGVVQECECDLGSASDLYEFIIEKLIINDTDYKEPEA